MLRRFALEYRTSSYGFYVGGAETGYVHSMITSPLPKE